MKLGLKLNKNTLLSIVFAFLLVVFALYLIKGLDKTGREGLLCTRPGFPKGCTSPAAQASTKSLR